MYKKAKMKGPFVENESLAQIRFRNSISKQMKKEKVIWMQRNYEWII